MAINLIAKITPKNDGFVGMVDADQVIGASGAGGYLPSSCISTNSIRQNQLISGSEYWQSYLHSSSSNNPHSVTKSQVGLADVMNSGDSWFDGAYAPSGVSGDISSQVTLSSGLTSDNSIYHDGVATNMYLISSSEYSQAYSHSSNSNIHLNSTQKTDLTDGGETSLHIHDTRYYTETESASNFYPSSNGNSLDTSYTGHSSNSTIHFTQSSLDDNYYPSSLGISLNTSYINHSSNNNNPHNVVWSDVSTAAVTDLDDNYAPSSGYNSHITNTSNPHSVVWGDVSTAAITDLNDNYYPSSVGNSLNTSYTNHSGQVNKHRDWTSDQGATNIHNNNITQVTVTQFSSNLNIDSTKLYGTISADRFSAYDDLVAESKIGNGDNQVPSGSHTHGGTANQNAFSYVNTDDGNISADSVTDTFTISGGSGIDTSGNVASDIVTISVSGIPQSALDSGSQYYEGYLHSSSTSNPHEIVWSDVSTAAITDLDDNYYPSSVGNTLNTSYTNHSGQSNKHIDHSGVDITAGDGLTGGGDITTTRTLTVVGGTGITANADDVEVTDYNQIVGNSNSGQTANAWLDTSGSKYNQAYLHSSSTSNPHSVTKSQVGLVDVMNSGGSYFDTTYYPSGVGNSLNTSYINHSSNTSNPHEVVWSDVSTAAKTDLADDYAPSSGYNTHINDSTIHYTKSTLDDDYYPSSIGAGLSGSFQSHTTDSTIHFTKESIDDDYYPSSIGAGLSGSYNTHIGTNNAHHDLITLSGTPNYITLSDQVLTRAKLDLNDDTNFAEGTGINLTTNTVSVLGYTLISANSVSGQSAKSWLDASGSNYNTSYTHSQDNSQAHSDYLINNGDDTTSGVITAGGFKTTSGISGANISGGIIRTGVINTPTNNLDIYSGSSYKMIRVYKDADDTIIKGGEGTNDDLYIYCNQVDTYPRIIMANDASIYIDSAVGSHIKMRKGNTESFRFDYDSNVSKLYGAIVTGDDLVIYPNSNDAYPYIKLTALDGIELYPKVSYISSSKISSGVYTKGVENATDTTISTPKSGQTLIYGADITNTTWQNVYPPISYNIANIRLSSQQNINLTRFTVPQDKTCYVIQAYACNSGGISVDDLKVQMLSGSTVEFSTSSNTLQQYSNPSSATGKVEIRFMYSGAGVTGIEFGSCMIQVGVY